MERPASAAKERHKRLVFVLLLIEGAFVVIDIPDADSYELDAEGYPIGLSFEADVFQPGTVENDPTGLYVKVLQENGYDGVLFRDTDGESEFNSYAVFSPNQIKSAEPLSPGPKIPPSQ